jgi:crossover junction endodeoxyribonuclease RusA
MTPPQAVADSTPADQVLSATTNSPTVSQGEGETVGGTALVMFSVVGVPVPQGSHRGYVVNGRAVVTNANPKTRPWRQDLIHAAAEAFGERPAITGPVSVSATFKMPRPKHHFGTGRNADLLRPGAPPYPSGKPDVDKLVRNLLDALTGAAVIRDDAQVVVLDAAKVWASPAEAPGVQVFLGPAA